MNDSERIARLEEIAEQHTGQLTKIAAGVESLLASRSFMKGAWAAVTTMAAGIAAVVGLFIAYLKAAK